MSGVCRFPCVDPLFDGTALGVRRSDRSDAIGRANRPRHCRPILQSRRVRDRDSDAMAWALETAEANHLVSRSAAGSKCRKLGCRGVPTAA